MPHKDTAGNNPVLESSRNEVAANQLVGVAVISVPLVTSFASVITRTAAAG